MKTDLERKLFLASKLPEGIGFDNCKFLLLDESPIRPITEREWDWIVREVEETLTNSQKSGFVLNLLTVCNPLHLIRHGWNSHHATWQQRTDALMKMENK